MNSTSTQKTTILTIGFDDSCESPNSGYGWKLYDFSERRPTNERDKWVQKNGYHLMPTIALRSKLRYSLAYMLDVYKHSGVYWSIAGEGMNCPWDTSKNAGLLIWEELPKNLSRDKAVRYKSAKAFLQEYNAWVNGETYYYTIKDSQGEFVDSCGGFIGWDFLREELIRTELVDRDTIPCGTLAIEMLRSFR